MRTIWILLITLLLVAQAQAVVITCVNEGKNVVRIDYSASDETTLPVAFALDVTVDNGATIEKIYDYKLGDSNAASRGFGICPSTMQIDENGKIINWGTPVASGGSGTSAATIEMASRYAGRENAPPATGTLCRVLVNTHGAQTVNFKVAQNTATGGVVLEDATSAKYNAVGVTLGSSTPPPPPPPPEVSGIFQQDSGPNGLVTIEAEDFNNTVSQGGHSWTLITSPSGFSGTGAMRAMPDNGANINSGYVPNSPRLDFKVNFVKTGRHYIWIRGYKTSGSDDSVHAGLNGQAVSSCDRISNFSRNNSWTWTSGTMDDSRASFNVIQRGVNTFNIWMREDGFRIDKIVITTNSSYNPARITSDERDDDDDD